MCNGCTNFQIWPAPIMAIYRTEGIKVTHWMWRTFKLLSFHFNMFAQFLWWCMCQGFDLLLSQLVLNRLDISIA